MTYFYQVLFSFKWLGCKKFDCKWVRLYSTIFSKLCFKSIWLSIDCFICWHFLRQKVVKKISLHVTRGLAKCRRTDKHSFSRLLSRSFGFGATQMHQPSNIYQTFINFIQLDVTSLTFSKVRHIAKPRTLAATIWQQP